MSTPGLSGPDPGVHVDPDPPKIVPPFTWDQLGTIITSFGEYWIGKIAVSLGAINILGFDPLGFLTSWGQALEAQAQQAYSQAMTAQTTASAAVDVQAQQSVAKPGYLAMDASADAVFPISQIQGATPTFVPVSAGASGIGFIPTPDNGKKFSIIWLGQNTTGLTGVFINIYKLNTITGVITLMEGSVNIVSSVSNTLAWNYYDLNTPFTTNVGDYYAAEIVVTGSGTYSIAGLPNHWLPANTSVIPQQMAATRAPIAVTYDATGGGHTGTPNATSNTFTWSHTATAGAAVVVSVACAGPSSTPTTSVTYGSHTMTLLGTMSSNNAGGSWVQLFGLLNAPSGAQTVSVTVSSSSTIADVAGQSVSYTGCASFGTAVTSFGTNFSTPSLTVGSALENTVVCGFVAGGSSAFTMTGFSGTQRSAQYPFTGSNYLGTVFGDAPGTTSTSVSVTVGGGGNYWGGVGIDLLPSLEPAPTTPAFTYSGNVPWFGLGGSAFAGPTVTNYGTPGTYTYTVPTWMKWGDKFDIAGLGAGGGGQSAYGWAVGQGGYAGIWSTQTLVYGVDIPLSTTTFTVTVGAGGIGGADGTFGFPGSAGGDTTIAITGLASSIAAAGGAGGNGGTNGAGTGPGPITFNGVTYPGGADVSLGQHGTTGGGGGAGGVWGAGADGGDGAVTITAYQAGTNP